jgi:hypothetical protein
MQTTRQMDTVGAGVSQQASMVAWGTRKQSMNSMRHISSPWDQGTAHMAHLRTCPCDVSGGRRRPAGSRARWRWAPPGSGGGPGRRGRTCTPSRTA